MAGSKGIANKSWSTLTRRIVINNCAQRIESTGSRTRIATTLLLAGQVRGAVGIYRTLGATVGRGAKI